MISAFGIVHKAVPVQHIDMKLNPLSNKQSLKMFKHTKTVHHARATGKQKYDVSVHDDEGSFFRNPKRIISEQDVDPFGTIRHTVHGGGMTVKGKATIQATGAATAGIGAGMGAGAYAGHRQRRK